MNVGKSVSSEELFKDLVDNAKQEVEIDKPVIITQTEVEVEVDRSPVPTATDKLIDTQNDPRFHPVTGQPLPPGREKNYLRMRSRIGRRR
jgi:hypothetical protein